MRCARSGGRSGTRCPLSMKENRGAATRQPTSMTHMSCGLFPWPCTVRTPRRSPPTCPRSDPTRWDFAPSLAQTSKPLQRHERSLPGQRQPANQPGLAVPCRLPAHEAAASLSDVCRAWQWTPSLDALDPRVWSCGAEGAQGSDGCGPFMSIYDAIVDVRSAYCVTRNRPVVQNRKDRRPGVKPTDGVERRAAEAHSRRRPTL
jgi:hypothetical protein